MIDILDLKCNMTKCELNGFIECGEEAYWKHPRYPDGLFCNYHKELLENFFKDGWSEIKEN